MSIKITKMDTKSKNVLLFAIVTIATIIIMPTLMMVIAGALSGDDEVTKVTVDEFFHSIGFWFICFLVGVILAAVATFSVNVMGGGEW